MAKRKVSEICFFMVGRPTDYNEDILTKFEEYIQGAVPQNQKIPTVEGLALYLNVRKQTLYNWSKIYPEFLDALEKLQELQKEYLTETGIFGGKEINANIISLMLKVNHNMIETQRQEIGGVSIDGKPQPFQLLVNAGQGFIPPTITLPSSPAGGVAKQQSTVQGTDMAPEGTKDIHSDNGSSKAGTS